MQMNDRMNQAYRRIMNQPQIQAVIYLGDRQPEIVNTQGFTPQAIEQVNQVAALIDEGNNEDNATADAIEKEMIRNDFIATILSSLNSQVILDSHVYSKPIVSEMKTSI